MRYSVRYIMLFAAAVSVVCSVFVSASAVLLKERQDANRVLDRQKNVLAVAGLIEPGQSVSAAEASALFEQNIRSFVIRLDTGQIDDAVSAESFDQRKAAKDPARSRVAPPNAAKVVRVPDDALVYRLLEDGKPGAVILPIEGKGLWSTLYGYLALEGDARTVKGITFYEHGETPGLGGEVDNPSWKALWPGRKVFDERGEVDFTVKKGAAGPPAEDPHEVDGLSGATITSRGVGATIRFWMGKDGYGPYLERIHEEGSS